VSCVLSRMLPLLVLCGLSFAAAPGDNEPSDEKQEPPEQAQGQPISSSGTSTGTDLNRVGRVNAEGGESRRNENVQFNLIDNNALKELMVRMGWTATLVDEFREDRTYFGAEFGQAPSEPIHVEATNASSFHGTIYYSHNNSVFSARSFFQVGDVQPARENGYGLTITLPVWGGAFLSIDASQDKIRGSVNGNVLVPMPDERTPLTDDPQLRPIVERFLAAYPSELPNRIDINSRMLNTNSPQQVDNDTVGIRLDQNFGQKDRIGLDYRIRLQTVDAFQLVAGQNPATTTHNHRARASWHRQVSPRTAMSLSTGFDRIGSVLVPEENSVGPMVSVSNALTSLGPGPDIPINRAENTWRYAGRLASMRGNHTVSAGFAVDRLQLNGYESSDHRGVLLFVNDFGRDSISNLRMGTPSWLYGALGYIHRGYRRWRLAFYAGDNWKVSKRFSLDIGLRHSAITRPVEVNHLDRLPFAGDWNNLAPRFGFAYELPDSWGILRGAYGLHYGQIFPVTFSQARYNPPLNTMFQLHLPDLSLPMETLMRQGAETNLPPRLTVFSPDLVTPYSHQYNFRWEVMPLRRLTLQLGYVGSRSHKLLSMWFLNRAVPVDGIPQTFETIQERRPNTEDGEHRTILNGSRGYFDAARASLLLQRWSGLIIEASYWFGKSLSLGPDHLNTAAGRDGYGYFTPSQFGIQSELKGPTSFDQPHAFMLRGTYEVAPFANGPRWLSHALGGWTVGLVALMKSGTPFAVQTGSDAPGFGNVDGTSGDRPNLVDPGVLGATVGHPDTSRESLPRSAFAFIEPTDTRGNLGWNTFRKGGIANINASVWRTFPLERDRELVFRAQSVNLTNTAQFAEPGNRLTNPDFGYITNTLNDGRAFQFSLQLRF
jgi:TonB-dependent receptor-like protein